MQSNSPDITSKFVGGSQIIEGIGLFIGLPMLEYFGWNPLPKLVLLVLVAGYCGYILWRDPSFGKGLLRRSEDQQISKKILLRSLIIAPALVGITWVLHSSYLFILPAEQPLLWMIIMVLYPIFSALPQEFIYRTFFFHRYKNIIGFKHGEIIISALAFSFLHLVYDNWWAVALSFLAGLLFGITYKRTQSLYWVTVEHVIYGWLLFTVGLGTHFYEGF